MAGRIDIWKDDCRNLPCYEVRYFDSGSKLKRVVRASVFVWEKLYCVGTISFGGGMVNWEFPEVSTDISAVQRKAYERAKKAAEELALDHKVCEIDDATVFRLKDKTGRKKG